MLNQLDNMQDELKGVRSVSGLNHILRKLGKVCDVVNNELVQTKEQYNHHKTMQNNQGNLLN